MLRIIKTTIFAPLLILNFSASAQHFALSRLFYPNVTVRAELLPEAQLGNNQNFGMTRTSLFGMMPLKSEVEAGFGFGKKLDIRARHTLLMANVAQINPNIKGIPTPENGYKTASVGVVILQASLRDKLWVYGGGGGITESNETFFTPQPYLYGGAARMRILGLETQILYGSIVTFSQKFRVVPIFGINKRLNDSWRVSALLPFQAAGNYRFNEWLNIDIIAAMNGYTGGFQQISGSEKLLRRSNYQHIKLSAAANAHLFTVFNVSLEAGFMGMRQLRTFNASRQVMTTQNPALTPFVGVSLRYITSKSKLSNAFTRKLGLGGDGGINW